MKLSWHVAGYGTLVALLVVALFAYERERNDQAKSAAVQAAESQVQKQLTGEIADLKQQIASRQAGYEKDLAGLESKFQKTATPQQLAKLVEEAMALKQPIEIITPTPTAAKPNPQPVAQVPLADAPEAKAYVAACEACKFTVPKLEADLTDRAKQIELAGKQIESLKTQRDAAVKASKGGSLLRRVVHDWKVAVIGGGLTVVALCGTGHCPK